MEFEWELASGHSGTPFNSAMAVPSRDLLVQRRGKPAGGSPCLLCLQCILKLRTPSEKEVVSSVPPSFMSVLGSDAGFIHARQELCQLNYTPSSLLSLFGGEVREEDAWMEPGMCCATHLEVRGRPVGFSVLLLSHGRLGSD